MTFKLPGHTLPGINQKSDAKNIMRCGRADSAAFQSSSPFNKKGPCWPKYEMMGTKEKGGRTVPNCVPSPNKMRKTTKGKGRTFRTPEEGAGMTDTGVKQYRAENPGSKLKTAVTTIVSKLKKGGKAWKRRKSFCARSRGWTGERGKAARRRWNC
tara:strand:- start:115 stop:579 length:465 start_codon:yes stop_codon:yes gene_type:complete